jgi:hypothetical protein
MEDRKKIYFSQENCLPNLPPREQEATETPSASKRTGSNRIPHYCLSPSIQSRLVIDWECRADDTAHDEGAPVVWEPRGHDNSQHEEDGACIVSASVVVVSGHQHRMDG